MANLVTLPNSIYKVDQDKINEFFEEVNVLCDSAAGKGFSFTNDEMIDLIELCDGQTSYIETFIVPFTANLANYGIRANYGYKNFNEFIIKFFKNQKGNRTFLEWFNSVTIE